MYTRRRTVGTRLSTLQDRDGRRGEPQSPWRGVPEDRPGPSPGRAGHGSTGTYTLIAPNENRRKEILRIAEQELADLEKWKQQNRARPIRLVPRRLGGSQSEAEVRQKQQLQVMGYKYQQKLKRDESAQIRKEPEEAERQTTKAIQREESNKLEEKKRLQDKLRREAFREHSQHKTADFLRRSDRELPSISSCRIAPHDAQFSTQNKLLEPKRQQQEEERAKIHQAEHRRVNNAFLARLQGRSQPGGLEQSGGCWNMNSTNSWGI